MKSMFMHSGLLGVVLALGSAQAETWYWRQNTVASDGMYYWKEPANWTNAAGTVATAMPGAGDSVVLGHAKGQSKQPYGVCNCIGSSYNVAYALDEVRWPGPYARSCNQGNFLLKAGGNGLQWLVDADSGNSYCGLMLMGEGEVPVHVEHAGRSLVMQMRMLSMADGDGKKNPTLVKTGAGRFVCFYQGSQKPYEIPTTLIRQGILNLTTEKTISGAEIRFDGNDASQILEFNYTEGKYQQDLFLKNGALTESADVANTAHGVRAGWKHQIHFSGTPKVNPMVFTGTFYGGAGLAWEPGSADYVFQCKQAVSATTGDVSVAKGTLKLTDGASFIALSSLAVSAGAVFEVDAGSGAELRAEALDVGDATAQVKLGSGVTLTAAAAALNGNALSPGTYTAATADWIKGDGQVVVETGPSSALAWTGAGADDLVNTPANWGLEELPDLTSGQSFATFTTTGPAELPAGIALYLDGIYLANGFSFTAAAGATPVQIGVSALTVADATAAAPAVYDWAWPVSIVTAQTWTVGANATFNLKAPLSGEKGLAIAGAGTLNLDTATDFAAPLDLAAATMRISGRNALGTGATAANVSHDAERSLTFASATNERPVRFYWTGSSGNANTVRFEGNNCFSGKVTAVGQTYLEARNGAYTEFEQGYAGNSTILRGKGTLVFKGPVDIDGDLDMNTVDSKDTVVEFCAQGNSLSHVFWAPLYYGRLNTRVPYALVSRHGAYAQRIYFKSGFTLDLCGNDQELAVLASSGGTITSAEPALLHLKASYDYYDYGGLERTNSVAFTGAAGFSHEGIYTNRFKAVSTTTGTLQVTRGQLRLLEGGSWLNATNCVVSGGSLVLEHAGALGTGASVLLSGTGSLELAYAGRMEVASFTQDGARYSGTIGGLASNAERKFASITGPGLLWVMPHGTCIILK